MIVVYHTYALAIMELQVGQADLQRMLLLYGGKFLKGPIITIFVEDRLTAKMK